MAPIFHTLTEAQAHLPLLIEAALNGQDILIGKTPDHAVHLTPQLMKKTEPSGIDRSRFFGIWKDEAKVTDAFFEPLPEDELAEWYK